MTAKSAVDFWTEAMRNSGAFPELFPVTPEDDEAAK